MTYNAWHSPSGDGKEVAISFAVTNEMLDAFEAARAMGEHIKKLEQELGVPIVARGQRYGFIRFGSRVDIYLPQDAQFEVSLGDKVKGAAQAIARAKTLPEAARLQADFVQQQATAATAQTKELLELSAKVTKQTFESVNAAAAKSFEQMKKAD